MLNDTKWRVYIVICPVYGGKNASLGVGTCLIFSANALCFRLLNNQREFTERGWLPKSQPNSSDFSFMVLMFERMIV